MCILPRNTFIVFIGTECPCEVVCDGLPFAEFNQNSKLREAKRKKYHSDLDKVGPKIIPTFTLGG